MCTPCHSAPKGRRGAGEPGIIWGGGPRCTAPRLPPAMERRSPRMLTDTDVAAPGQALYPEVATGLRQRQQRQARLRRAGLVGSEVGVALLGGAHLLGRDLIPWNWVAC